MNIFLTFPRGEGGTEIGTQGEVGIELTGIILLVLGVSILEDLDMKWCHGSCSMSGWQKVGLAQVPERIVNVVSCFWKEMNLISYNHRNNTCSQQKNWKF